MEYKRDCRYFVGEAPCEFKRLCEGCHHYSSIKGKFLIIKFGAMGDVLRTTPLLRRLKKDFPECWISWATDEKSVEVLKNNPFIDDLLVFSLPALSRLQIEEFGWVISLDKAREALAIATLVRADRKTGFGLVKDGKIFPLNPESEYAFQLGLDDHLKFHLNQKTYQELIFEMNGFDFRGEEYVFMLPEKELTEAKERLNQQGLKPGKVVGLNAGGGTGFANKGWTVSGYAALIERLSKEFDAQSVLLGGPLEQEKNKAIAEMCSVSVLDSGCHNSILQFAGFISLCDVVVTGDTLGMHLALALGRKVVALFGPTCHQEIYLYGRGKKVLSPIECSPCYLNVCDKAPNCQDLISVEEVIQSVRELFSHNVFREKEQANTKTREAK